MKLQSPLERLPKPDLVVQARLEVWHRRLQARSKASWPVFRQALLDAAQRAQDARSNVIG